MNPRNCFNHNGNFDFTLLYVELFNEVPSIFTYDFPEEMELETKEIRIDKVLKKFPDAILQRAAFNYKLENPSEVDFLTKSPEDILFDISFDAGLTFSVNHRVVYVNDGRVVVLFKDEDVNTIKEFTETVYSCFPKKENKDYTSKVNIIKCYQGDYFTSEKDIKPVIINVDENYNDDFKKVYEDSIKFLNERSSGLILYYGEPGTGKTHLIRHLISSVPKEYIIVSNGVAQRLGEPDLMTFVTDHTDSVFILEDCEQLLEDRGENSFNNAINTILNMSDGLLSDICNIKFICTFNAPISKIDPALLRKGRCAAKYEFKPLKSDKVKFLNDRYNLGHTEIKDMTLAEVYNSDKTDYSETTNKVKIGF